MEFYTFTRGADKVNEKVLKSEGKDLCKGVNSQSNGCKD